MGCLTAADIPFRLATDVFTTHAPSVMGFSAPTFVAPLVRRETSGASAPCSVRGDPMGWHVQFPGGGRTPHLQCGGFPPHGGLPVQWVSRHEWRPSWTTAGLLQVSGPTLCDGTASRLCGGPTVPWRGGAARRSQSRCLRRPRGMSTGPHCKRKSARPSHTFGRNDGPGCLPTGAVGSQAWAQ